MIHVYIAGPLNSSGNVAANIREACRVADILWREGIVPAVPHFNHFWDMMFPAPTEQWLALDFEVLSRCDALLRLPGESKGADREEAFAHEHKIPIYGVGTGTGVVSGTVLQALIADAQTAESGLGTVWPWIVRETLQKRLDERQKELDIAVRALVEAKTVLGWVEAVMNGEQVSELAGSFPVVQRAIAFRAGAKTPMPSERGV